MISDYCNEAVEWKQQKGSTNDYDEAEYTVKSIPARVNEKIRLVRNKLGVEVVSSSTVLTACPIQVGDLINDSIVIAVKRLTDLDGITQGYEVML